MFSMDEDNTTTTTSNDKEVKISRLHGEPCPSTTRIYSLLTPPMKKLKMHSV